MLLKCCAFFLFVHFFFFKQLNAFVPARIYIYIGCIHIYIFLGELNVENEEPKFRLLMLLFRFRCCYASANVNLPKYLEIRILYYNHIK